MATTVFNPTQQHLLKLFAHNNSEEYAKEIQAILAKHYFEEAEKAVDELWDEGVLDQSVSTNCDTKISTLPNGKVKIVGCRHQQPDSDITMY